MLSPNNANVGSRPKQQQRAKPVVRRCFLLLSFTDGRSSGALQILVEGPAGLDYVDRDPGPPAPAKTPRPPDSFTVRWVDVTDMTDNHFCLYVSLIQKRRLLNVLFQK